MEADDAGETDQAGAGEGRALLLAPLAWAPPANERSTDGNAFDGYDICFRFYYNQYCPGRGEPTCLTDPVTGRTICW